MPSPVPAAAAMDQQVLPAHPKCTTSRFTSKPVPRERTISHSKIHSIHSTANRILHRVHSILSIPKQTSSTDSRRFFRNSNSISNISNVDNHRHLSQRNLLVSLDLQRLNGVKVVPISSRRCRSSAKEPSLIRCLPASLDQVSVYLCRLNVPTLVPSLERIDLPGESLPNEDQSPTQTLERSLAQRIMKLRCVGCRACSKDHAPQTKLRIRYVYSIDIYSS